MTHRRTDRTIPTWAGRAPLRWHLSLAAGVMLGFLISSLIGAIL